MRHRTVVLVGITVAATSLFAAGTMAGLPLGFAAPPAAAPPAALSAVVQQSAAIDRAASTSPLRLRPHESEGRKNGRTVLLHDAEGTRVGFVRLSPQGGGVRVAATLRGLTQGFHGFHVHTVGVCDPDAPDGPFTSAEGHYVGAGDDHGTHAGDLPSLYADAHGRARLVAVTDAFTVRELLRGDGSAIMVHLGRDNFANIPPRYTSSLSGETGPDKDTKATGDAGARVACGALRAAPGVKEGAGLVTVDSSADVDATVERILADIEEADLQLVTVVDHAAAAEKAGLQLRPTTLVIFGSPESGTPLMQSAQTAGIDLPQKLLVWRDADGVTHVTYNDPRYLAARHGITGQDKLLDSIAEVLRRLATGSGS
jgi:Cu-Zn family superoxide dismutase